MISVSACTSGASAGSGREFQLASDLLTTGIGVQFLSCESIHWLSISFSVSMILLTSHDRCFFSHVFIVLVNFCLSKINHCHIGGVVYADCSESVSRSVVSDSAVP